MNNYIIDQEFRSLIPPLSPEEYAQLEQNILEEKAVHDPIIVWDEENIIVDGHNRLKVLQDHEDEDIEFTVRRKSFSSRDAVIAWMCANQLGRRNLSDVQRTILLGLAYEARKRIYPGPKERDDKGHFLKENDQPKTKFSMAEEFKLSPTEVERSGRFVRGLNELEKAYPGTTDRIKSGDLEVTKKDVMSLTSMDEEDKSDAMKNIVNGRRIAKAPEPAAREAYNIDDFRSELSRKVSTLDKSLELTCILTHKSCLESEEGKDALRDTLLEMTEILRKYFALCD